MNTCSFSKNNKSQTVAFFDVDETLITIKSMFDFFDYWASKNKSPELKDKFDSVFQKAQENNICREKLNRLYYQFFSGVSLQHLSKIGQLWFDDNIKNRNIFIEKTVMKLKEHKAAGDKVVFVSGSMEPLLRPIADYLEADEILCTELLIKNNILTGEIGKCQTIGIGKSDAIQIWALDHDIELSGCYAYGDDISDMNMLLAVGNPVYVGKQFHMINYAKQHNWQIIN